MKKIVAATISTAVVLGAIYGTVSGSAAAIFISGVDLLQGSSVTITDLECPGQSVTCTTITVVE